MPTVRYRNISGSVLAVPGIGSVGPGEEFTLDAAAGAVTGCQVIAPPPSTGKPRDKTTSTGDEPSGTKEQKK